MYFPPVQVLLQQMMQCTAKSEITFLIGNPVITARNEVGARLYFHRRLWFCPRGGRHAWLPGWPVWLPGGMVAGQACMVAGGHAWLLGGMCGCWGCAWLPVGHAWLSGGMRGCRGACMVVGGHAWWLGGHAWDTTRYGQWEGGTHPTGMHSCLDLYTSVRTLIGYYL